MPLKATVLALQTLMHHSRVYEVIDNRLEELAVVEYCKLYANASHIRYKVI